MSCKFTRYAMHISKHICEIKVLKGITKLKILTWKEIQDKKCEKKIKSVEKASSKQYIGVRHGIQKNIYI